jgi:Arc/MetJ-type ribon-helix-helix transcriptional regulator
MRTSRTLSISLPPAQLRESIRLARKENRTMSELVREALRRYQQPSGLESPLAIALADLRADARLKGTSKLSKHQIDAEIAAVRRERQKKSTKPSSQ